jgi:hypothetical protein
MPKVLYLGDNPGYGCFVFWSAKMNDLANPDEPEFVISLNTEQLADLGRLTATWSQRCRPGIRNPDLFPAFARTWVMDSEPAS